MSKVGDTNIGGGGGNMSDDTTASKAQVLEGYKTLTTDSDDEAVNGTMPNASGDLTVATNNKILIPQGFHDGKHYASNTHATMSGGTWTPSTANQTISCSGKIPTSNFVVAGDGDLQPANIRSGVNIFGVTGTLVDYNGLTGNQTLVSSNTYPSSLCTGLSYTSYLNFFSLYGRSCWWIGYFDLDSDESVTWYPNTVYPFTVLSKSVDLTPYSSMSITYCAARSGLEYIGVRSASLPHGANYTAFNYFTRLGECTSENTTITTYTKSFDISSYNGQYFIAVGGVANDRRCWGLSSITLCV